MVEVNRHGVNSSIKAHILPEEVMIKCGFTDRHEPIWYYSKEVPGCNDISFNVSIPKADPDDFSIDIIDDDYGQPYDYQHILNSNTTHKFALRVKAFVELQMEKLQKLGVLSGHVEGEYI